MFVPIPCSSISGPLLGLFILGFFVPCVDYFVRSIYFCPLSSCISKYLNPINQDAALSFYYSPRRLLPNSSTSEFLSSRESLLLRLELVTEILFFQAGLSAIIFGFCVCLWISVGSVINVRPTLQLPVSIDSCPRSMLDDYAATHNGQYPSTNVTLPWEYEPR